MKKIVHISDLHFGTENREITKSLIKSINEICPDLVVISGDITQRAREEQFIAYNKFAAQIEYEIMVVPGNHDIPLYNIFKRFISPLKNFKKIVTKEEFPIFKTDEMIIVGVNSARSFTFKNGRISIEQIQKLKEIFCAIPEPIFKGVVIHHNLLPTQDNAKTDILGRTSIFLKELNNCGIDMMFTGHLHQGYLSNVQKYYENTDSIIISQAGTAISTRTRNEKNSFNFIVVHPNEIKVKILNYQGSDFKVEGETTLTQNVYAKKPDTN